MQSSFELFIFISVVTYSIIILGWDYSCMMSGNPQEEVEPFSIWFYMKMYETIVFFLFVFNYLLIYVNYS